MTLRPILILAVGLLLQACGARAESESAVNGPIRIESVVAVIHGHDQHVPVPNTRDRHFLLLHQSPMQNGADPKVDAI